jgi:hypothetical protein
METFAQPHLELDQWTGAAQGGGRGVLDALAHVHDDIRTQLAAATAEPEPIGDPITGLKWTHRTPEKIARRLTELGFPICANTVARLLHSMDFTLRVNHKDLATTSSPERNQQFDYISALRTRFVRQRLPMISVDSKKRELVGNFKNPGAKWDRSPERVNDHDFRSDSRGVAIPYGIYDLLANRGSVFVGVSHDTPARETKRAPLPDLQTASTLLRNLQSRRSSCPPFAIPCVSRLA